MTHRLQFRFSVPNGQRRQGLWEVTWQGCAVMGILNVTPDSFSDGGKHLVLEKAMEKAKKMVSAGVMMLDIGGESTRPGSEPVEVHTELDRVLPLLRELKDAGVLLSIDTMKPEVAAAALSAGAHLINDVTGLRDPEMIRICAESGAAACIMHMQGEPRSMQQNPTYDDVVAEVHSYLYAQAQQVKAAGVPSVLLDPGIGFGKTLDHNLALLRRLAELSAGADPVLIGASRKRLIDYLASVPHAAERDPGTLALHLHAASQGAALVRAHAASEHVQALRVQRALEPAPLESAPLESEA